MINNKEGMTMVEFNKEEQIIEFIAFCIENFKVKHGMKGKAVANLFYESKVLEFLKDAYEMLHTQSKDYIIEEIEVYLRNRGYKF